MRKNRIWSLVTLLGLVALLAPSFASAQELRGKFKLPFETRWAEEVLPEGEYTFVISGVAPRWIRVQREGQTHIFMPVDWSSTRDRDTSALIVARRGDRGVIRSLYLKEVGLTLHYAAPKTGPELMVKGPVLIQRVPLTVNGK